MKRIAIISVTLATLGAASFAAAATGAFWTPTKAERMVSRDTLLRPSQSDRADLEHELNRSMGLFAGLHVAALDEGNAEAAARYGYLVARYSSALRKLRTGLAIEAARCAGAGTARQGQFARFHCQIRSEAFAVPSWTLIPGPDGEPLSVTEGLPRVIGPFHAQLLVRVTGTRTMTSRLVIARPATPPPTIDIE